MAEADPAKKTVRRSVPLTRRQRLVSFLLGAAALGCGATATFITTNSAGSGVMLAVGAFFMLISITGDRPTRAQIAGNQVDFDVDEAIRDTLDSPEPQAKATLAEHIIDQQLPVSPPARAQAEYVLYERDVIAALGSIAGGANIKISSSPRDERFDFIVRYRDKRIGVVVKVVRSNVVLKQEINQVLSVIQNPDWSRDIDGVLLIAQRTGAPARTEGELLGQDRFRIVQWEGQQDNENLRAALDALVEKL